MNITSIIVEYNPFHNGHIHHINKTISLTKPDILIAICSGNFCQRGDVSIIDKFQKCQIALNHKIDLVVEIPYIYTVQNADVFANCAIKLAKMLNSNHIVFGSETKNIKELKQYANLNINVNYLKEIMSNGTSFPKAYGLLAGSLYPNDILAISYLRALKGTNIKAHIIKRTSNYHDIELDKISSATSIRYACKNNIDYSIATPFKILNPIHNEALFKLLHHSLNTTSKSVLKDILLVNEGIENLFIKNIYKYNNYDDFINACTCKRYTKARIQRTIVHIINNINKLDAIDLKYMNYIRVLGFNQKGRNYLKLIKDKINIVTQFKNIPEPFKSIEWTINNTYANLTNNPASYIKKELSTLIIKD